MQSGNVKKVVLLVCVIVAIGIWSYNLTLFFPKSKAFRITSPSKQVTTEETKETERIQLSSVSPPFVYQVKHKDPFQPFFLERKPVKQEVKKSKPKPVEIIPPALSLIGILWDSKNPQVVVADSSGQTYVLRRGDTIGEIKVTRIERKEVMYNFKNKTFKLLLPEE
jgi:type II secretory pathway component PulC